MNDKQLHLSNQICFPLYSASRLVTKAYKPHLDAMGITYPQYLVLMVLWENNGLTVKQIKEELLLNTNTLSPLLQRMEKMGLLRRERSKEDERSVIIILTDNGQQLKFKALAIPEQLISGIIAENINMEDIITLKQILGKVITKLSDKEEASDKE